VISPLCWLASQNPNSKPVLVSPARESQRRSGYLPAKLLTLPPTVCGPETHDPARASGPALGSWLAAALVVIFMLPFLLHRTITEDRILQVELAGYSDYAAWVRWRLVPDIW